MQTATLARGHASFERIQALDRQLAHAARKSGPLRFALGAGLNALAACSGHADLGFSSIEDYGRERCEYGATSIAQARLLARRAGSLPHLRRALICGRISGSMATEIARVASPENEERLLQLATGSTVARFKEQLAQNAS